MVSYTGELLQKRMHFGSSEILISKEYIMIAKSKKRLKQEDQFSVSVLIPPRPW